MNTQSERSDDWFQTYTGKEFHILAPRASDIVIEDISHALALQCRYNGHCLRFYSIAEHSVRVARIVNERNVLARWGLLHDAAEAYMGDMVRPLKRSMPGYRKAEARLMRVIAERFGLSWPMPPEIMDLDRVLLATEMRDLMAAPPKPWASVEGVKPLPEYIVAQLPEVAEQNFLELFEWLFGDVACQ